MTISPLEASRRVYLVLGADSLNEADRLDRAMLEADIRARLLDIEQVRSAERNPQLYADTLAASLAAQVLRKIDALLMPSS